MTLAMQGGPTPEFFGEVAVLVVVGALIAYACHRIGLLPIVGFLVTGVVIGPNAVGVVTDPELVDAVAELGVILLLFTIGIEFSLERLARIRRLIFGGGGIQVLLTTVGVTLCLLAFGVEWRVGVFSGFLVALSSTAIVLKVLGERGETQGPAGRFSVGVLIFQDLAIVPMVLLVPMLGIGGGSSGDVAWALLKAAGIIVLVLLFARRLMPPVLELVARTCSQELFLLSVVAICFGTAWLTSLAGLSLSLGAFLAGVIVSESRFSQHALGEILPLQILFSAAFFMSVGMLLDLSFVVENLALVIGVVVGVLALKTLCAGGAALALREPPLRAIGIGLGLAQVGEFSFVLERSGRAAGLAPFGMAESGGQVLIAVTVILMASTPLLLALGARLSARAGREKDLSPADVADDHFGLPYLENHVIVAGYGNSARALVQTLTGVHVPMIVVTLSPIGATEAEGRGLNVLRGDSARVRTLQLAGIDRAKVLVIPDDEPAHAHRIAMVARALNPTLHLSVRTRRRSDALELYGAGADEVVSEEFEGIVHLFADVLRNYSVTADEIAGHETTLRRGGYAALLDVSTVAEPPVRCAPGQDCLDLRRFMLREGAPVVGKTLSELDLPGHGLEFVTSLRDGRELGLDVTLQPGDELELRGMASAFVASAGLFRSEELEGLEPEATPDELPARIDIETEVTLEVDPEDVRCSHLGSVRPVLPSAPGCEECLAEGHSWVHLRVCMICGHVGCCDDSPGRHATAHFHATDHAVMRSIEPGESWGWCFADQVQLGPG